MLETYQHQIISLSESGLSGREIARQLGIGKSRVNDFLKLYREGVIKVEESIDPDKEIIEKSIKLAFQNQKLQDVQRVDKKAFREYGRIFNVLEELNESLIDILENHNLSKYTSIHKDSDDCPIGVVHLSDLHFTQVIYDVIGNKYDFSVASKRLEKFVEKTKTYFKAYGVTKVALFLTGDLISSSRRLDEITSNATNCSNAVFVAVDILQQLILSLNEEFNVTVASVIGNESRITEDIHFSKLIASDNYDIMIHTMLSYLFKDSEGVVFLDMVDPTEKVVNVNGQNFLLIHGNLHSGIARTSNMELGVAKIKARYASQGVDIRYVLMGHIHQAFVSDLFSRSSGLPGDGAYSQKALNLSGRSSQNAFLVWEDGSIDGIKIDLQEYNNYSGYKFDEHLETYNKFTNKTGTVVIQSVLI